MSIPKAADIKEEILDAKARRTSSFRDEVVKEIYRMTEKEVYGFSITLPEGIDNNNEVIKELRLAGYEVSISKDRDHDESLTVWIDY